MIYFDNAATTFPKPECVYERMDKVNRTLAVNAGRGSYALAREAAELINDTRNELLDMVNGKDVAEVVFTASATLALNQIIGGLGISEDDVVYVSPYEHNAVIRTLYNNIYISKSDTKGKASIISNDYEQDGFSDNEKIYSKDLKGSNIIEIPLKENLELDMEQLKYMFSINPPSYVFAAHVSNVTGYILPVEELAREAKKYNATVVIDASQSLGLVNINLSELDIDFLVFAGHKTVYGPFGIGGFYVKNNFFMENTTHYDTKRLLTFIAGGTGSDSLNLKMSSELPVRYEAASPNIVAIAGLKAGLEYIKGLKGDYKASIDFLLEKERSLAKYLSDLLKEIPEIELYMPENEKSTGIVAFNVKGYNASDVGMILDEDYDIAVRTGYHCAALIHEWLGDMEFGGVVRVSVGVFSCEEEIEVLVRGIREIVDE